MSCSIVLGDLHLGRSASLGRVGIGSAMNSRIVDQQNLLEWTLQQAIEHSATRIILTGDVFEDPRPHPTIIKLLINWLKCCEQEGVAVDIIHGNHDILRSGQFTVSALDVVAEAEISNVSIFSSVNTVHDVGVSFTYLPFRDRRSFSLPTHNQAIDVLKEKLQYELAEIPRQYKKILIGHLAIEGSIFVGDEISDVSNELFCPVEMFQGYDCVWMGHVHKPQVMSGKTETTRVAHIGSMDRSDFGESDHKKIIVLIDTESDVLFKEIEIPTRPLVKMTIPVEIGCEDTTAFVIDQINKQNALEPFSNSIAKIEINLHSPDLLSIDRAAVEKHLQSLGVQHISGLREVKKISFVKKVAENLTNVSDINVALKQFSKMFVEDSTQEEFLSLASEIVKELRETEA